MLHRFFKVFHVLVNIFFTIFIVYGISTQIENYFSFSEWKSFFKDSIALCFLIIALSGVISLYFIVKTFKPYKEKTDLSDILDLSSDTVHYKIQVNSMNPIWQLFVVVNALSLGYLVLRLVKDVFRTSTWRLLNPDFYFAVFFGGALLTVTLFIVIDLLRYNHFKKEIR